MAACQRRFSPSVRFSGEGRLWLDSVEHGGPIGGVLVELGWPEQDGGKLRWRGHVGARGEAFPAREFNEAWVGEVRGTTAKLMR